MNSTNVCVDSSVALAWLLITQQNDKADALRKEWRESGVQLLGPPLFRAEVESVLRQNVFFKKILPEDGEEAFSIFLAIPIKIIDTPAMYRKAWELAKKFNLPVCYDTQYLAVAELEDCEFWTADRRFFNSLGGKGGRVKWVGEYTVKAKGKQ
ncbi:MAG: type II toxin-antitoxin system VapC family toxin [Chloroflexi bacterium]|nr:type II toxin-antitoxin system VapC family toxin [Chloroflexota bacterium]